MQDPLQVLVVGLSWPPETFLARLFRGLLDEGLGVTVACGSRPAPEWTTHPRFHWVYAPSWSGASATTRLARVAHFAAGAAVRSLPELRSCATALQGSSIKTRVEGWHRLFPLVGRRWDVLYLPWVASAPYYRPLFRLGRPTVVSCRGSQVLVAPHDPARPTLGREFRQTFMEATAVHCVSEDLARQAVSFGLSREKARIIRPGVDTEFYCPPPEPRGEHDRFRVLTVGSLKWVKGHEYALSAIRLLRDQGVPVSYELIGDGPDRQRLLFTAHDLHIEDCVTFRGSLTPEAVRDRLRSADAFLLSSLSEGISNAVVEAMSCGLPVVTTDSGGMREALEDGAQGLIVPPRDPDAMATALRSLWEDPARRRALGGSAREQTIARFALPDQQRAFAGLLRDVAA